MEPFINSAKLLVSNFQENDVWELPPTPTTTIELVEMNIARQKLIDFAVAILNKYGATTMIDRQELGNDLNNFFIKGKI